MKLNKKIILVMVAVLSLFFVLVTNLVINTVFPSDKLISASEGEAKEAERLMQAKILRGTVYDRNGNKLAYSEFVNKNGVETQKRIYPYEELFAHTVGFYRGNYDGGRKNLEERWNSELLAISKEDEEKIKNTNNSNLVEGASMQLTLDYSMTAHAKEEFEQMAQTRGTQYEDFLGSVIVMNPRTGEIYCMYSNPSFNPDAEYLSDNWNVLETDEKKPFVSRATGSVKIPGSVFKIVTAMAAVENGEDRHIINDEGVTIIGDTRVVNDDQTAHGNVDLKKAIEVSSNVYFATLSQHIEQDDFMDVAEKFFINEELVLDIPVKDASIQENMNEGEYAAAAYGQGTVEVTPLHMAMVASAVANDGVLVKPYMVESVTCSNGDVIYTAGENDEGWPITVMEKSTNRIVGGMVRCVESGTGWRAAVPGITVAGKTGTAQVTGARPHTWFIGFAPAYDPQIAICVMCENSDGGGGSVCGPIARGMIEYCRDNGFITE